MNLNNTLSDDDASLDYPVDTASQDASNNSNDSTQEFDDKKAADTKVQIDNEDVDKTEEMDDGQQSQNKHQRILEELSTTGCGRLYDEDFNMIAEVKVENIYNQIKSSDKPIKTVIFDGIISQRLVDLSKEKNIESLVAVKMNEVVKKPETIKIITKKS